MRALEQPVNQPLVRVAVTVVLECLDLARIRRQPQQIKRQTPDQRAPVRLRRGGKPVFSQLGQYKRVDRVCRPRRRTAHNTRHLRPFERSQRPPIRLCGRPGHCLIRRFAVARVRRSHLDPSTEIRDHALREPSFRGHRLDPVGSRDRLKKQALIDVARHDRGSAIATGPNPLATIKPKPPAQLLGRARMTLIATLDENRPDSALEKRDACGIIAASSAAERSNDRDRNRPSDSCSLAFPARAFHVRPILVVGRHAEGRLAGRSFAPQVFNKSLTRIGPCVTIRLWVARVVSRLRRKASNLLAARKLSRRDLSSQW